MDGGGGREGEGPAARPGAPPAVRWRLPAFYFIHFFGVGVTLPFLNVYFHSVGMAGLQLGLLNAAPRLANALAPPLLGALADKFRMARGVLLTGAVASIFLALAMWGASSFWPLLILVTLHAASKGSLAPIAENACLREIQERGGEYGRVRWWGSLGFIVAALGVGRFIDAASVGAMFPVLAAAGAALAGVVWFFPREAGPVRSGFRRDVAQLLRSRPLLTFYGAATLVSLSSGPFGVYFSIHLRELGHSAWLIGLAWTAGVASEIGFLVYARRLQGWMGVKGMIALGMAASALRWEMVTWTESGALLVAIQVLHGLTFGVYHAGAIQYVDRLSGPATKNTAQSLYGAATFGAGSTAGALLAGWLLPAWGFIALLHAGALLALAGVAWFALALGLREEG